MSGLAVNAPDTIMGYPYVINQAMASPVASTNPTTMLFGDMQKYIIRKVKDMSVLRLNERYADFGQVGFISFMRIDGNLVDAGTHPINVLQQHSYNRAPFANSSLRPFRPDIAALVPPSNLA